MLHDIPIILNSIFEQNRNDMATLGNAMKQKACILLLVAANNNEDMHIYFVCASHSPHSVFDLCFAVACHAYQ